DAARDPARREILKKLRVACKRRSTGRPALHRGFTVEHYAGPVDYGTEGWLDKNDDRLLPECESLICESSFPLVRSLGREEQGKSPRQSISKKYMQDLEALLRMLGSCDLHYIRCFKPNEEQAPHLFEPRLMLDQIVQCGTIELVNIMHRGYPHRCPLSDLGERYKDLLPDGFQSYGSRTFVEALMLAYEVPRGHWALGVSRLFLRAGQLQALEDLRSGGRRPSPEQLQGVLRTLVRRRWRRACQAVMLCLWVPRLAAARRAARARAALRSAALVCVRLHRRLEAARRRLRDRHAAGRASASAARCARRWLRKTRAARAARAAGEAAEAAVVLELDVTRRVSCATEACDEVARPCPSAAAAAPAPREGAAPGGCPEEMRALIDRQVQERIRVLEQEMCRKQQEVLRQMRALQEMNERLELEQDSQPGSPAVPPRPRGLPPGSPGAARSPRRPGGGAERRRQSSGGPAGRRSAARRASTGAGPAEAPLRRALGAVREDGPEWWAVQRQLLTEDLSLHGVRR
ncbi:unnamed protein product, partial [Prorocentrum cordatum]